MPLNNTYDKGAWKAICDQCGREFKSYLLTLRWDGLMVCKDDWETRHPQDFVRGVADKIVPAWTRPEQSDTFLPSCTMVTIQGMADYGTADCAQADRADKSVLYCTEEGSMAKPGLSIPGCMVPGKDAPRLNDRYIA